MRDQELTAHASGVASFSSELSESDASDLQSKQPKLREI